MAIQLDGIDYTLDTPLDNSLNLLNYINQYCKDNNILNGAGEVMQFVVNAASPMWLLIVGLGYMCTIYQKLVYAAGQSFSIPDCSDQQLLNLAEIRMTKLSQGHKTVINGVLTAAGTGPCTIDGTDILTYEDTYFYPATEYTALAGATVNVVLVSLENAPYLIPANTLTFDTPPTNFGSLTTQNSTPGEGVESISSLRKRLQGSSKSIAAIDLCRDALTALEGVQSAAVFFNASLSENLVIGSITLLPREAGIFIQGYSERIAEVYMTYMTANCPHGTMSQDYITQSGQIIPVAFNNAIATTIYIKVVVRSTTVPIEYQEEIRDLLLSLSGSLGIGVDYTQKYLINVLDYYDQVDIIGLMVSMDNNTWSYSTDLQLYQIGIFTAADIFFEIQA